MTHHAVDALTQKISDDLEETQGNIAIMAGHQVLDTDGHPVNLGIFPSLTAEVGRAIVHRIQGQRIKLFTLIDDKRWLEDEGTRRKFWSEQIANPSMAIGARNNMLESYVPGKNRFIEQLRGLWSEQALMSKFNMRLRREEGFKDAVNSAIEEINIFRDATPMAETCMRDGCAINGCSREVIEMLGELSRRKIESLILFIPNSCKVAVSDACEIATSNAKIFLEDSAMRIKAIFLNSGLNRAGLSTPMSAEQVMEGASTECFSTD